MKIFCRMSVTKQLMDSIDFHSFFSPSIQWMSMGSINCLVTVILQDIFFIVQQKIDIHTGLEQHDGK